MTQLNFDAVIPTRKSPWTNSLPDATGVQAASFVPAGLSRQECWHPIHRIPEQEPFQNLL
jgi:hypothetical protein